MQQPVGHPFNRAPRQRHDVGSPAFLDHACEHDRGFPRAIGILPPPVVRVRPRVPPQPVDQPPDLCHLRACHAFIQAQEATGEIAYSIVASSLLRRVPGSAGDVP